MLMLTDMYHEVKEFFEINPEDNYGGFVDDECYDDACMVLDNAVTNVSGYVASGCTKAVFVPSDTNCMVLKAPFNANFYDNYEDENDESDPLVEPFKYANTNGAEIECWNYCERELFYYEKAVEDGFGMFFAETRFYGYTEKGYPLYLQEHAETFRQASPEIKNAYSEKSYNSVQSKRETSVNYYILNATWIAKAIDLYGEELVERFIQYLNKTPVGCDLHQSNYGYRTKDGAPVLIDWAGYYED